MNALKDIYSEKETKELVEVLELKDDYTPECVQVVLQIIKERNIDKEELEKHASTVFRKIVDEQMEKMDPLSDNFELKKSNILSNKRVKSIYQELMEEHMSRKDGFRFDVWKYAIGG